MLLTQKDQTLRRNTTQKLAIKQVFRQHERPLGVDEILSLYERTGRGHHHHFHCRACNRVFELPGCALKEEGAAPEGFVVEDHEIFLFGVCPSCIGVTK